MATHYKYKVTPAYATDSRLRESTKSLPLTPPIPACGNSAKCRTLGRTFMAQGVEPLQGRRKNI
ncbi:hypothetical protein [Calothrix sp. NIES-2100]|uniref:hypothetical protein n=1 Tax=Calothrix sp. NIES-2100 TaxID=1954172 RepID=UPI0030DC6C6E